MSTSLGVCAVCQKPVPPASQCSSCRLVSYCSKDHQKQDWSKHKSSCRAYEVKSSRATGRYVIATRNIKKGDVIVNEEPLVVGPCHINASPMSCMGCFFREMHFRCPKCEWPICYPECPALATRHTLECEIFSKIKASLIHSRPEAVLPLRCYLLQKYDPGKWKVLEEMVLSANQGAYRGSDEYPKETRIFLEEAMLKPLNKTAPEMLAGCSMEKISLVFHFLNSYSLVLKLPHTGTLRGVLPVTSCMVHSCLPNTRRILDVPDLPLQPGIPHRCRVILRAATDIRKGDSITTVFVSNQCSSIPRNLLLMGFRGVLCGCARCLDPRELGTDTGTMKCTQCNGWVLPIDTSDIIASDWKCHGKCQKVYPRKKIESTIQTLTAEENVLCHREKEQKEELKKYTTRLHNFLHPNHYLCMRAKTRLIYMPGSEKQEMLRESDAELRRKAELCEEVINFMKHPCFETSMLGFDSSPGLDEILIKLYTVRGEMARRILASGNAPLFRCAMVENVKLFNQAMSLRRAQYDQPIIPDEIVLRFDLKEMDFTNFLNGNTTPL